MIEWSFSQKLLVNEQCDQNNDRDWNSKEEQ